METLRAGVREDLIHNVANTARSHDSVTVLYDLDVRLFIEPPPRLATALQHQLLVGDAEAAFTSIESCPKELANSKMTSF